MESNFIVSARKYRPQTFDSVVGQQSITKTLKNAIKTNQLAHAYLFCGPRGVGKTTCARIFAKTINCQNLTPEIEACNECQSCKAFNTKRSLNIHELDAASNNSVEDIRKLIEQVRIPPQIGTYSVYIIDEVHMLSVQAFNAFLKTLEEPPKHAIFILATTEKHKILPTILSRCQIFDFNRIQVEDIVGHLMNISQQEGIEADPDALNIIAQKADGALRDALSFFDQIASFSNGHITYEKVIQSLNVLDYDYYFKLTDAFLQGDYNTALMIFNDILNHGFDSHNFIVGLSSHFRDLLVSKDKQTVDLLDVGQNIKKRYAEQSAKTGLIFLLKALDITSKADVEHKLSKNKRLHTELMLLKLSQISGELLKKVASQTMQQPQVQQQTPQQNIQPQTNQNQQQTHQTQQPENQTTTRKENKEQQNSKTKLPSIGAALSNPQNFAKREENKQENSEQIEQKQEVSSTGTHIATQEEIQKCWQTFGERFKAEKPRLYALFYQYPIKLEKQIIKVGVMNNDQLETLTKLKAEILQYINTKLNSNLDMEIFISKAPVKKRKPYTNDEKYQFLKEKNKNLDNLKHQFRLFFD